MIKKYFILALYLLAASCTSTIQVEDPDLIIPGKQADGYHIGERITKDIIQLKKKRLLFKDILGEKTSRDIEFNQYRKNRKSIILLKNNIIKAIVIHMTDSQITSDSVKISRGYENFTFNYGNKGSIKIKSDTNTLLLYLDKRIIISDDNNDDSIDLLIVF